MFSTLSQTDIIILETLNLLSANAFNLVKAKILSFGKKLEEIVVFSCSNVKFNRMFVKRLKRGIKADFSTSSFKQILMKAANLYKSAKMAWKSKRKKTKIMVFPTNA